MYTYTYTYTHVCLKTQTRSKHTISWVVLTSVEEEKVSMTGEELHLCPKDSVYWRQTDRLEANMAKC